MKEKKKAFREWKTQHTEELLCKYRREKRTAKRAVAMAKKKRYDQVYEKMETRAGEKKVYRIAKSRAKSEGCWVCEVCERRGWRSDEQRNTRPLAEVFCGIDE